MLKNDEVKVVVLARDPRGMTSSRRKASFPRREISPNGTVQLHPILAEYVKEHCVWLETNYNAITTGPTWLQKNSILVRYEDMTMYPHKVIPNLFNFVGLNGNAHTEADAGHIDSISKWRKNLKYEEVKIIQDLCSDHIYKIFGWRKVRSKIEFENKNLTFIDPMPGSPPG
ncbi:carbohydrate sulfotransferase 3-like [Saccoglossus kowalevskii]|uniref:Carbohydrate sulfotransferase 3-like n=1 Tax=Saccoglossus kowalevskii TaxID=10224 RepID=A0ABM0MD31_SACKO|nr:PREDICTED: carbohydrate sulfotransferase 3-like [Saccoglossus kowalevskii]